MPLSVLTVVSADAPGLVAAVSGWLADIGANIVDASQTRDQGHALFLQRIELEHPSAIGVLRAHFAPVAAQRSMRWEMHERPARARVAVLASREGHCLYDVLSRCETGDLPAHVVGILSDHDVLADAGRRFDIPFRHLPLDARGDAAARRRQEAAVCDVLRTLHVDLIVLARYMRVLSPAYCRELGDRTINIHHSFLPAFKGASAYQAAWERGVKMVGATAHYVTADLDEGPIIAQDTQHVTHRDSPADLARVGRDLETLVLARAVRAHLERRVIAYGGRTVVFE